MQGVYEELYTFLVSKNVEETKLYCFKDWLTWYIDNNLYHVQRNENGQIEKVFFIRRLNSNDISEFPDYIHPDLPNIDKITKYYLHRPEGNVFYGELLIDDKNNDDLKVENLNFAFTWAINKFNPPIIDPSYILLYYKKGHKVKMNMKDIEDIISRYRG